MGISFPLTFSMMGRFLRHLVELDYKLTATKSGASAIATYSTQPTPHPQSQSPIAETSLFCFLITICNAGSSFQHSARNSNPGGSFNTSAIFNFSIRQRL
ncbi:MAG: hypothetical protein MET45_29420 [Nostoc sp. LLA-1]|nr:hypothetical protein [Cyanocohniella sp. LLY]